MMIISRAFFLCVIVMGAMGGVKAMEQQKTGIPVRYEQVKEEELEEEDNLSGYPHPLEIGLVIAGRWKKESFVPAPGHVIGERDEEKSSDKEELSILALGLEIAGRNHKKEKRLAKGGKQQQLRRGLALNSPPALSKIPTFTDEEMTVLIEFEREVGCNPYLSYKLPSDQ